MRANSLASRATGVLIPMRWKGAVLSLIIRKRTREVSPGWAGVAMADSIWMLLPISKGVSARTAGRPATHWTAISTHRGRERTRLVWGRSAAGRGGHGGRSIIKKKTRTAIYNTTKH